MFDILLKPAQWIKEGKKTSCPGGLLKPLKPYFPLVLIFGCSDGVGKEEMNILLREKRPYFCMRRLWPKPNQGPAEESLWKRTKPLAMKPAGEDHRQWRFTNKTPEGRAKNRGVIVWSPAHSPRKWTIVAQRRQAENKKVFKSLLNKVLIEFKRDPDSKKYGIEKRKYPTYKKVEECIIKKLKDVSEESLFDTYYDLGGVRTYAGNPKIDWGYMGVHPSEKGPMKIYHPDKPKIKYTYHNIGIHDFRKLVINDIICAQSIEDLKKRIERRIYQMYLGIKESDKYKKNYDIVPGLRRVNIGIGKLAKWIDGEMDLQNSLYSCFKRLRKEF